MSDKVRRVLFAAMAAAVGYFVGAWFGFPPHIADDLSVRAIGFAAVLICVVIAVCTIKQDESSSSQSEGGQKQ